jgi:uncharacterized membrane protein YjgN (DUF898 family)
MSYQITLSSWSGASKTEATEKLAKVFQLKKEKSATILDHLCQGWTWRFDYGIPDHQADTALTYLQSLGFVVSIQPIKDRIDPLSNAVIMEKSSEPDKVPVLQDKHSFKFQGDGHTLFNISFINLIKTVFTLGIYRFWAKNNVRQYLWGQTLFLEDRFSYHGTGKELLSGACRFGVVIVILGLINIYIMFNIGLQEGQQFFNLFFLFVVLMIPVFLVAARSYRLSRTAWRNIRFSFQGKKMEAFTLYLIGVILSILTLGLYWPFFKMKSEKFWREHSWFGNVQFSFSGTGKDFIGKFFIAVLMTPLTLGFYLFWFAADLKRYLWSHTHLAGATFDFPVNGNDYMKLKVINFFILLFTIGAGFSWTVIRNQRFVTDNLVFLGSIEFNRIVHEKEVSEAFEEGVLNTIGSSIDIS